MKIKKLTLKSTQFPEALRYIPDPPKQLFIRGNPDAVMTRPLLAIVGSRKVTAYGRSVTSRLASQAAAKGITIVSGLALGVDAIAHQAALEANGTTVAVLANGPDKILPASNHHLGERILRRGGAVISEYPPGSAVFKTSFFARNRIVSGLSDGVLVTEAAARSGTMHTVNFALDQGKPIMAVPGNITSPMSEGTNTLIKTGATPVTDISDILDVLGISETISSQQELFGDDENQTNVLKLIAGGITDADRLLIDSKLEPALFNQTLTMLEINGRIQPLGGNHWGIK